MNQILFPFPRLRENAVMWSGWEVLVDQNLTKIEDIKHVWDANSQIRIGVSVEINQKALTELGGSDPEIILSVACPGTARTISKAQRFSGRGETLYVSTFVEVNGREIADQLSVIAQIVLPLEGSHPWLDRRIIAENRILKHVPLDNEESVFPTVALSFKNHGLRKSPWEVIVSATELSDGFRDVVLLRLNTDFKPIVDIIERKSKDMIEAQLHLSMVRTILSTTKYLASATGVSDEELAQIIDEFPYSIGATSAGYARKFLHRSLSAAHKLLEKDPGRAEYILVESLDLLGGA